MIKTGDIEKKVKELSAYLTNEAIANALKLTPEAVEAILEGRADITIENQQSKADSAPVIHVSSIKTSYRQKIISLVREKGGVGCTAIAIGLSYLLSTELKTLLLALSPGGGISDVIYYLNPDSIVNSYYTEESIFAEIPGLREMPVAPNYEILDLREEKSKDPKTVTTVLEIARNNYDAVVIDLPNRTDEPAVKEAINHSNALIGITRGDEPELSRLYRLLEGYSQKEIYLVANMCNEHKVKGLEGVKKARLEFDPSLERTFKEGDLPRLKSSFMKGIINLKETMYNMQQKSFLQSLFNR